MMHLLRCLFFYEAHYQFSVVAVHLAGRDNELADLSRDRHISFLSKALHMDQAPSSSPPPPPPPQAPTPTTRTGQLDVSSLDLQVHFYFHRGLADSTHRTYRAGVNRYLSFCVSFNVSNPFPLSESTLCYFVVSLAREGPTTIKTYLSAVRHAHIERGFPDLRDASSLPRMHMIQSGVQRERADQGPPPPPPPPTPSSTTANNTHDLMIDQESPAPATSFF